MDQSDPQPLALIMHLLAEKDRLVSEKDQLVVSKDKLWREMHAIIQERDVEIERLRSAKQGDLDARGTTSPSLTTALIEENRKLKEQNAALAQALKELLDRKEEEEDCDNKDLDLAEDEPRSLPHHHSKTWNPFPGPLLERDELIEAHQETSEDFLESYGTARLHDESVEQGDHMRSSQDDCIKVSTRSNHHAAADRLAVHPSQRFTILPIRTVSDDGRHMFGELSDLAPPVRRSIQNQFDVHASRIAARKIPSAPSVRYLGTACYWSWLHESSDGVRWTIESPRTYACAACFNAYRACLSWLQNMRWAVLPLPPAVRRAEASWRDADFYLRDDEAYNASKLYHGVWDQDRRKHGRA